MAPNKNPSSIPDNIYQDLFRKQRDRYRHLINAMPIGVAVTDIGGKWPIRMVNQKLLDLLELGHNDSQKTLADKGFINLRDLFITEDDDLNEYNVGEIEKKKRISFNTKFRTVDESNYLDVNLDITTTEWGDERVAVFFVRDMTREIRKRVELNAINKELREYAYTIAHDLKTPLVTIGTFVDYALETFQNENRNEKCSVQALADLRRVKAASSKLINMCDGLYSFAKHDSVNVNFEVIDLNDLFQSVKELLHVSIEQTTTDISSDPGLPFVIGIRAHYEVIFQNLIENAIKFRSRDRAPEIKISFNSDEDELTFADNGKGIPDGKKDEIFKIFKKVDDDAEGTGLGLSLVKKFIVRNAGDIRFQKNEPFGSKFILNIQVF